MSFETMARAERQRATELADRLCWHIDAEIARVYWLQNVGPATLAAGANPFVKDLSVDSRAFDCDYALRARRQDALKALSMSIGG